VLEEDEMQHEDTRKWPFKVSS